ncbi:hypothetical protein [Actinomadura macrotermitis]|uniref:hypothetical protein n=1 Tax=Actinomadura macrotermitis TaxID=2585200 RepID=UPI001295FCFC|nr:hypothetical protein [Actinomadura macrotermitis]
MINTSRISRQSWAAACPGASIRLPLASASLTTVLGGESARYGGGRQTADLAQAFGLRLRGLFIEQPIQDAQGRSVFAGREAAKPSAPATAHVDMPSNDGGMWGPHPWRRPV